MDNNKLVSIIIPTYKRPGTLYRAVNSALKQTYRPIEIIVVDDNNPDTPERLETEKIMEEYKDNPLVIYIKHAMNKNGSAARNTGARLSKGDYLAFLDDDDEYLPKKIEVQVKRLENLDEDWGACYCRYYRRKNNGKLVSRSTERREGFVSFHELCRNFWHGGSTGPIVRRAVFFDVGGFDESFHRNQDYEYMLKITKKYKLAFANIYGEINYVDSYRESKRTYDEIVQNYIETFKEDIDSLDDKHKIIFEKMMILQKYRYFIVEKHSLSQAVKYVRSTKKISFLLLLRYTIYLLYRKVFKISCGFNI